MTSQPKHMTAPPPNPPGFQYRLLREEDREEALLIKAHALEQEHFALSNNFTLHGVAGAPAPDDDPTDPELAHKQLARFRATRKQEIEAELVALHERVDAVYESAKNSGRTIFEEARVRDAKKRTSVPAVNDDGRPVSPLTGKPINLAGKGQGPT